MRDQNQRRLETGEFLFQPLDCRQIQVVGRFIQHENVRLRRECPRKCSPSHLSPGQQSRVCGFINMEFRHEIVGAVGVIAILEAAANISANSLIGCQVRFLWQVPDGRPRFQEPVPAVGLYLT